MDILGFTSKINSSDFKTKYNNLISTIGEHFKEDKEANIYLVSDSIIVISTNFRPVKDYTRMIYTWGMSNDFWIRGAIAQGQIEKINSDKIVNENKNVIIPYLGDAYLTAYNLESKLNMAGIVIDDNLKSDNPDLPLEVEYMEYQEYLLKEGSENKKRLLLPDKNWEINIANKLQYFREMLGSHSEDMDKYINTFCFYVKLLMTNTNVQNRYTFLDSLIKEVTTYSGYLIIPQKILVLFVAVFDGLFPQDNKPKEGDDNQSLYVSKLLEALRSHDYLSKFEDYLLEYDKRRNTTLYRNIHESLFKKGINETRSD